MRFNEVDVAYFGASPTAIIHRGWMWKKGDIAISSVPTFAMPPLATLYKKRWFVLKGNMLFYFRNPDDTAPLGFILLEHCQVSTAPIPAGLENNQGEIPPFHLKISFLSESSHRTYELVAPTANDRVQWIQRLASASVDYLLNEIKYLRSKVRQLESDAGITESSLAESAGALTLGESSEDLASDAADESTAAAARDVVAELNGNTSLMYTPSQGFDHALAFSMRLTASLPLALPNLGVTVTKDCFVYLALHQARGSSYTEWVPIKPFAAMTFFTCMPVNLKHETLVSVYLVTPDFAEHKLTEAGIPLRGGPNQLRVTLPFDAVSLTIGTLLWTPMPIRDAAANVAAVGPAAASATTYQFYQLNESALISEETEESPWAMQVPRLLLQCWIAEEERIIKRFMDLTPHAPDIHVIRLRQLDIHKQLLCYYRDELVALNDLRRSGTVAPPFLRKSVEKTTAHWQMCALNCVVQRMRVGPTMPVASGFGPLGSSSGTSSTPSSRRSSMILSASPAPVQDEAAYNYSVITFGAPTAHALGYSSSSTSGSGAGVNPVGNSVNATSPGTGFGPSTAAPTIVNGAKVVATRDADTLMAYHATTAAAGRRRELEDRHAAFTAAARELQATTLDTFKDPTTAQVSGLITAVGGAAKEVATLVIAVAQALKDMDEDSLGGYQAHVTEVGFQLMEEWIPLLMVRGQQLALLLDAASFEAFAETLATVADHVTLGIDGATALLDHHMLLLDAQYASPTTWQLSRRRADWIFSQCLGAVVTGLEETVRGWTRAADAKSALMASPDAVLAAKVATVTAAWGVWTQVGWLTQFESLLSSQGEELGMLTDMKAALFDVEKSVSIALHALDDDGEEAAGDAESVNNVVPDSASTSSKKTAKAAAAARRLKLVRIDGERGDLVVSIGIERAVYDRLPRRDAKAKVVPLLFTQGINEQQSLSNVFGGSKAQDAINRQSYDKLQRFVGAYRDHVGSLSADAVSAPAARSYFEYVKMLVHHFEQILGGSEIKLAGVMSTVVDEASLSGGSALSVGTNVAVSGLRRVLGAVSGGARAKNTDILVMAAHITRVLGSLHLLMAGNVEVHDRLPPFGCMPSTTTRFTSCKSAKDRTSMSVTLEQCFILQAAHLMSPGDFEGMLTAMRACGTRMRNVERNIGKPTYAFNAIQWNILPRLYRPPKYTINQGAQS
ncbi:hypothetical protein H9P43_003991 [Blastocladiella emersonii ATCC 22665]|nr:hypothetical protein H9P43_003991 [Blastocladiella emersonii ATCC 22665]